jgi:YlmC/YmxH family sporulation protein
MSDNTKYFSDIEKYEIINYDSGDKYNSLGNNDIIIDDNGYFKFLILNENKTKFSLFGKTDFLEIPWEYVKKIGTKTIIIDINENEFKKNH